MAQDFALVDEVRAISGEQRGKTRKPARTGTRVLFSKGAEGRLDPESPRDRVWAEVLESRRQSRQPVYVEIDPDTHYITSLLLPLDFLVSAISESPQGGGLDIELEISQARHTLRRDHPRFGELYSLLERARREKTRVLVTDSLDSPTIVDVRPAKSASANRRK
jgi:hypothetical protein